MSQPRIDSFASSPLSGSAFIAALILKLQSVAANRTGTSRPDDPVTGGFWLDTTTNGAWVLKFWDGTQDISFLTFDNVNHAYSLVGGAIPVGSADGTVDVITCTFSPTITLAGEPVVFMLAAGANATTTPTLNANALGAKTITRSGGQALRPGDIPAANAICIFKYNSSTTKWELLNPAVTLEPWVAADGTVDAITATYAPAIPALYDGLCVSVRAAGANTSTTPTLNVNGLGAKTIVKQGGQALATGDIPRALYECICVYNLANTRWELLNPATGAAGTAEPVRHALLPASSFTPTTTNGATIGTKEYATNDIMADYLIFPGDVQKFAALNLVMPPEWDRSTIKFKFYWAPGDAACSAGDTVEWEVAGGSLSDGDTIDAALGTAQVISDTVLAGKNAALHISDATPALTIGGSPALGDFIPLKISRNVSGTDDMTEPAWLFAVVVQYSVSNAVVAW